MTTGQGMYEDMVAAARRTTEAAVRESQERVDMAVSRSQEADKAATEATKSIGDRWVNRINAMRRRAADQARNPAEHRFGPEDTATEPDELTSLSAAPKHPDAFGLPEEHTPPPPAPPRQPDPGSSWFNTAIAFPEEEQRRPEPPRRQPPPARPRRTQDDDEDYTNQSWLQGG